MAPRRVTMGWGPMLGCALVLALAYRCACQADSEAAENDHPDAGALVRMGVARDVLGVLSGTLADAARRDDISNRTSVIAVPAPPPGAWTDFCGASNSSDVSPILAALDATTFELPSVVNSTESKCSLTTFPDCTRFEDSAVNLWIADLFIAISENANKQVNLSRFDLYEGHLFVEDASGECGMLFRSRAYPKFDNDTFPVNLGFCQEGSDVDFDQSDMDFRNFLWFQGNLAVLDISEGSALQDLLLQDNDTRLLRTTFEEDWGTAVASVSYFDQLEDLSKEEKIFVC